MTILQDQTGQTGGGGTKERVSPYSFPPSIEGGYQVDLVKSTTTTIPVQPGTMRVRELEPLIDMDVDGVGSGRLESLMTGTGDKHAGGLKMTAMETKMIVEDVVNVGTTPSVGQDTTLETGKPLVFHVIDTLPDTDVPGPRLMIGMDDKKRNLLEDNPPVHDPVSRVLGQGVVVDDDLPSQPTQREGVQTRRKRMTQDESRSGSQEPQKCSHTKKGKCMIHGDGARKVPIMMKKSVVGEGGVKTTESVKKYIWRCDTNRRGIKMIQSNISSFLTKCNPEKTGRVAGTSLKQVGETYNLHNSVGQRADSSNSLPHHGDVERFGDSDDRNKE